MKKFKTVLIAAAAGLIVGLCFALFRPHGQIPQIHFFQFDPAMKAHWNYLRAGIGIFVLFSLYWEIAAKGASEAVKSESKASRAVHVALGNAAILLEIAPINGLGRFIPAKPGVMIFAIVLEAAGLAIAIWARRHLGKHWSGEITIKQDHELIRTGPYTKLRHPIYTGILTMYFGMLFLTGEWLGLIGFALGLFAYVRKIRLEEANLAEGFGSSYEEYRKESWALFPGIW